MEIVGLEPRRSDLARGIVIARGAAPLSATQQRALWERLQTAGITEASEDTEDDPDRQWLAAPWLPVASPLAALAGVLAFEHAHVQAGQAVPLA